jgi:membrane associated rhomboid family serine protease
MGVATRDYWRNPDDGGRWAEWGFYSLTPVVKYLMIANAVVFVLQILIVRQVHVSPLEMLRRQDPRLDQQLKEHGDDPEAMEKFKQKYPYYKEILEEDADLFPPERISVVQEWCELDTNKVVHQGQVWRLLTHAFCHDRNGIFHIVFNMLFLYWFGCTLEMMYGWREFLLFYLTAAVFAGLVYVGLELYTRSSIPAIGASGAVMAVVMLYAMHFPREPIRIIWFSVEMRWLVLFYLIWDLHPVLLAIAGDRLYTGVASAAHVGGLAFGFLYAKFDWRLESMLRWVPAWGVPYKGRAPRSGSSGLRVRPAPTPETRLDKVLKKLSQVGPINNPEEAVARFASYFGQGKSVDVLTATDVFGHTALMFAAEQGKTEAAETLILAALGAFQAGKLNWFSWINQRDDEGRTALQSAREKQHTETHAAMEAMITRHLNDRSEGFKQRYPSISLDQFGHPYLVTFLDSAMTALEQASSTGDSASVEELLRLGADRAAAKGPTPEDRPHTALSLAAMKGHTLVVKALLDSFKDFGDKKDYVNATFHSAAEPFQLQPAVSFAGGKDRQAIVALLRVDDIGR